MGHRQKMTDKQRSEWDAMQYENRKQANKGLIFKYLTDEMDEYLEKHKYVQHIFSCGIDRNETHSSKVAKEIVENYRINNCYARIICIPNRSSIREYAVFYKEKKNNNGKD